MHDAGEAIVVEREREHWILRLRGRVNVALAQSAHAAAIEAAGKGAPVIVDAAEAEHVDTSVLQVMLALERTLKARGQALGIRGASESVREWMRMGGFCSLADAASAPDAGSPAGVGMDPAGAPVSSTGEGPTP